MKTENLAIILTDIVGYTESTSRLSRKEQNEMLNLHNQLLYPIIRNFGGKVVKTIGDALLLVFRSPTDAMLCSMAMQDALFDFNRKSNIDEELHIRIAASLGEVRVDRNDIFGEPVNLTSRIESITPEDEIYLSDAIYLAMNKAEVPCIEVGLKQLKGITEPVRVWKIPRFTRSRLVPEMVENEDVEELGYPYGGAHLLSQNHKSASFDRIPSRKAVTLGLVVLALLVVGGSLFAFLPELLTATTPSVSSEPVAESKTAKPKVATDAVKSSNSKPEPATVSKTQTAETKNVTVAVKTDRPAPAPTPKPAPKPKPKPAPTQTPETLSVAHPKLMAQLNSGNASKMRAAARQIVSKRIKADEVLLQLQTGLEKQYLQSDLDRTTVDALSWYCKALGASGQPEYLPILEQVAKSAPNHKLKGYAEKSLTQLRRTVRK